MKIVMYYFPHIFKYIRTVAVIVLLCIMARQQWNTFLKYKERFFNPIKYTRENYGNDFISQYGNRFEEITKMFPGTTRFCYYSEIEDFPFWITYYSLTQYYLAPNLIIRQQEYSYSRYYAVPNTVFKDVGEIVCDTILYNLYRTIHLDPNTNFHLKNGWNIVKDFNNGLIVLAK